MSEPTGKKVRVTLRWVQILDNMEPFFKEKGEFVFRAKVWTDNHGGHAQETRIPKTGHYSISDHPRWNKLTKLDRVLFEGDVTDHLVVQFNGEELDRFSANDALAPYRREFTGPIEDHVAMVQPGDEASNDPENLDNWRLGYEIEVL